MIKKIEKLLKILKTFKNPLTVLGFFLTQKKIDHPFLVFPKKGNPFKIGRFSDKWLIKKILNGEKVTIENGQIIENSFFLREGTSDTFIYKEIFLDQCYKECLQKIDKDSIVIDVGSYIGLFSCYVSPHCKKIYAYEPVKENYSQGLKNTTGKNIELLNKAVWSSNEEKKCDINGNTLNFGQGLETIQTINLEKIFAENNIPQCDLLKIDVEGCEYEILFSTPLDIFKKIKSIIMEYHPDLMKKNTTQDLVNFLEKNDYNVVTKPSFDQIGLLMADKK